MNQNIKYIYFFKIIFLKFKNNELMMKVTIIYVQPKNFFFFQIPFFKKNKKKKKLTGNGVIYFNYLLVIG